MWIRIGHRLPIWSNPRGVAPSPTPNHVQQGCIHPTARLLRCSRRHCHRSGFSPSGLGRHPYYQVQPVPLVLPGAKLLALASRQHRRRQYLPGSHPIDWIQSSLAQRTLTDCFVGIHTQDFGRIPNCYGGESESLDLISKNET